MALTKAGKIVIGVLIAAGVYGGITLAKKKGLIPEKKEVAVTNSVDINTLDEFKKNYNMTRPLRVGINTWGGYAGGLYANKGLTASAESNFYTKYGILVDIILNDDFQTSRESWKSGDVDIMWTTADGFPNESGNLPDNPEVIFQFDWSRGGDVIIGTRGIKSINDLKGKKIAVALGTPSHSLLLKSLEAANMKITDIVVVTSNSAPEAAQVFKAGKVDAAVVWSPDDQDCLAAVTGSSIILSTKNASNIIADVFFAKKGFIDQHEELIKKFTEGWLAANAAVNSDPAVKDSAIAILSTSLNQPADFCKIALDNVRLTTYGDNVNFFNLTGNYKGVKGEDLYNTMTDMYKSVGYLSGNVPSWKSVVYTKNLRNIVLTGPSHEAESVGNFTVATKADSTSTAITNKTVSITFASGAFTLSDDAQTVIDNQMVPVANQFASSRIRVQGNTDNVGDPYANKKLSFKRANAVVGYLISQHKFAKNRFVVIGNGSDKPLADNATEEGKATNRRTDFEVVR